MKTYDLIIIGAGPAGLTAGLYAVRSGLKTAIISEDIGGTTNKILKLENYPGFSGSGFKLMQEFHEQLKNYKIDILLKKVEKIEKLKNKFLVKIKSDEFECKSLIITSGTKRRKLEIPGEKKLDGRGVSYCVTCDGFFFKDKVVAIIGGSDCAAMSALDLSNLCKKVYVVYRQNKLRCEKINLEKLEKKKNVEIIYKALPLKILGDEKVEGLLIDKNKEEIKVKGVFVEIGAEPLTSFVKNLKINLNEKKEIIVDENMKTNIEGVFAAGDVTNQKLKQVVVAAGQGSIAGKSAYDYVNGLGK